MEVELSSIPTSSQPDKELATTLSLPEPLEAAGPAKDDPAGCNTLLAPLPETVQSTLDPLQAIGPYLTSAGIDKTSFSSGYSDLPTITEIKNGHVLELYHYFTNTLEKTLKECVRNLIAISGHTEASELKVASYICKLVSKHKNLIKKKGQEPVLDQFLNTEFHVVRSRVKRDTSKETKLMGKRSSLRNNKKELRRKLQVAEARPSVLKETALQNEGLEGRNHKEKQGNQVSEKLALIDAVNREGGFWRTPAIIEREFSQLQDKDDSTIKHAVYAQLQFAYDVLQVTGPENGIFQHSKTLNGERTDLTKEELKAHLMEVVQGLYQPTSQVGGNQSAMSGALSYKAPEESEESGETEKESEEKCSVTKIKLTRKIHADKVERAIQSKQQHLESLVQNPSLLVGKTIHLACWYDSETFPDWCKGIVIGIANEDIDPLFTEFCVDFSQCGDPNRVEWIYILRLIEDLQNQQLIIYEY